MQLLLKNRILLGLCLGLYPTIYATSFDPFSGVEERSAGESWTNSSETAPESIASLATKKLSPITVSRLKAIPLDYGKASQGLVATAPLNKNCIRLKESILLHQNLPDAKVRLMLLDPKDNKELYRAELTDVETIEFFPAGDYVGVLFGKKEAPQFLVINGKASLNIPDSDRSYERAWNTISPKVKYLSEINKIYTLDNRYMVVQTFLETKKTLLRRRPEMQKKIFVFDALLGKIVFEGEAGDKIPLTNQMAWAAKKGKIFVSLQAHKNGSYDVKLIDVNGISSKQIGEYSVFGRHDNLKILPNDKFAFIKFASSLLAEDKRNYSLEIRDFNGKLIGEFALLSRQHRLSPDIFKLSVTYDNTVFVKKFVQKKDSVREQFLAINPEAKFQEMVQWSSPETFEKVYHATKIGSSYLVLAKASKDQKTLCQLFDKNNFLVWNSKSLAPSFGYRVVSVSSKYQIVEELNASEVIERVERRANKDQSMIALSSFESRQSDNLGEAEEGKVISSDRSHLIPSDKVEGSNNPSIVLSAPKYLLEKENAESYLEPIPAAPVFTQRASLNPGHVIFKNTLEGYDSLQIFDMSTREITKKINYLSNYLTQSLVLKNAVVALSECSSSDGSGLSYNLSVYPMDNREAKVVSILPQAQVHSDIIPFDETSFGLIVTDTDSQKRTLMVYTLTD